MDRIEFKKFIQKCVTLHFDHIEAEDDTSSMLSCYLRRPLYFIIKQKG